MYPYYKGKRQADPAPVTVAICLLAEALQHVGIMSLSPRGVEADDVIATLASRAVQQGMQVRTQARHIMAACCCRLDDKRCVLQHQLYHHAWSATLCQAGVSAAVHGSISHAIPTAVWV
jgi:hypothetical protein